MLKKGPNAAPDILSTNTQNVVLIYAKEKLCVAENWTSMAQTWQQTVVRVLHYTQETKEYFY